MSQWDMNNVENWERWLCEEQWWGYRLDEILIDTDQRTRKVFESVDFVNLSDALRSLFILISGFNGETGEATEHFKKWIRDGKLDKEAAALELGDVFAYLTWLAHVLGFTLADLARMNHKKLVARGKREGS